MRTAEYSNDGYTWYSTYSTSCIFERITDDCPELDKKGLEEWLTDNNRPSVWIEYSTDGGYNYTQFRRKYPGEDAGRIITFVKMHYKFQISRRCLEYVSSRIQLAQAAARLISLVQLNQFMLLTL